MKQLLVNQIWQLKNKCYRILYIDREIEEIFWINSDDCNSLPESIGFEEFNQLKKNDYFNLLDSSDEYGDPSTYKAKSLDKWNTYCKIVDLAKSEEPQIYLNSYFNRRCSEIASQLGVSRMLPRRVFLKYWKGGKVNLALLPKLNNSGGKGKERRPSTKKRGRPNTFTKNNINVDDKLKVLLQAGFKKFYLDIEHASLETAYENFLQSKYYQETLNREHSLIPSSTQFRYWGEKKYPAHERKKRKLGLKIFNKDIRTRTESSLINITGPGSVYQIDSTKADIELVSSIDRSIPVGSPTLYFVSDVFSRMIVGVLVTLDEPSYYTAARALYNAIVPKEQFFKEERLNEISAFQIKNEDWPCNYIPDAIVADRAELLGHQSNNIIQDLGITIENTAAYRADLKGVVENHFRVLHTRIKGVDKNFGMKGLNHKQRGVRDARKDAVLNLKEYYIAILSEVLVYNSSKVLDAYPFDEQLILDIPSPTPLKLWNWGIKNASGKLRPNNIPELKQRLLPRKNGKINKNGLRFNKLWYNIASNGKILNKQILLQNKALVVEVLYDPFDLRKVYIYHDSELVECALSKSRNPIGIELNEWEFDAHLTVTKKAQYENQLEHKSKAVESLSRVKEILNNAKKKKLKKKTNSLKPSKIRENKRLERNVTRQESTSKSYPKVAESTKEVKVIKLEPSKDQEELKQNEKLDFFRKLMKDE